MDGLFTRQLVQLACLPWASSRDLLARVLQEAMAASETESGALLLLDPAEPEPALLMSGSLVRQGDGAPAGLALSPATLRHLGRLSQPHRLSQDEAGEVLGQAGGRHQAGLCIPVLQRRRTMGVLCLGEPGENLSESRTDALARLLESALPSLHRVALRERLEEAGAPVGVIGISDAFLALEAQLRMAGWFSQGSVLVTGERGSGKELAAWAIHLWSRRRRHPLVPVLASATSEELFAAELFGYERNTFTGATTERAGKFLAADGGTIFLDEAGDIPLPIQAAVLRVLETGEVPRLGRDKPVCVDVRVIAATNRDLPGLIQERRFRSDLYDRLSLFEIRVPPLRERREDIPCLVRYFMTRSCAHSWRRSVFEQEGLCRSCRNESCVPCVAPEFLQALQGYGWPGNVRQLKHLILQLMALHPDEVLDLRHLPLGIREPAEPARGAPSPREAPPFPTLEDAIRSHIEECLQLSGFNQSHAARLLDLPLSTLRSKMKKLGIPARP